MRESMGWLQGLMVLELLVEVAEVLVLPLVEVEDQEVEAEEMPILLIILFITVWL